MLSNFFRRPTPVIYWTRPHPLPAARHGPRPPPVDAPPWVVPARFRGGEGYEVRGGDVWEGPACSGSLSAYPLFCPFLRTALRGSCSPCLFCQSICSPFLQDRSHRPLPDTKNIYRLLLHSFLSYRAGLGPMYSVLRYSSRPTHFAIIVGT